MELDPSTTIKQQDDREMYDIHRTRLFDKNYLRIMNDWQLNLIKTKKKKAIIKYNFENYVQLINLTL